LHGRGVDVRLGTTVAEVNPDAVRLTDGQTVGHRDPDLDGGSHGPTWAGEQSVSRARSARDRSARPSSAARRPTAGRVSGDERDHYRSGRSNSAATKPAAALRIWLDAAHGPRLEVCGPRRTPRSSPPDGGRRRSPPYGPTCAASRLIQPPSLVATDSIAAHSESYYSPTSGTSRIARSLISRAHLCPVLDMAPSSRTGASGPAGVV
jgi:hypothetical protein